jgi:hypothetical protein
MTAIEGWAEVQEWMGIPATFHDGELTDFTLLASGASTLRVLVRGRGGDTRAVRIELVPPIEISLFRWSERNIILEMVVAPANSHCEFSFTSSQGAEGKITAKRAKMTFV